MSKIGAVSDGAAHRCACAEGAQDGRMNKRGEWTGEALGLSVWGGWGGWGAVEVGCVGGGCRVPMGA